MRVFVCKGFNMPHSWSTEDSTKLDEIIANDKMDVPTGMFCNTLKANRDADVAVAYRDLKFLRKLHTLI